MTGLAIAPKALSSYLQNVVDGRSMREIAAPEGCEPSTVLRRIRKVEELRDHPEWEKLLAALEESRTNASAPAEPAVSRATILAALGLTAEQTASEFAATLHVLSRSDGLLLAGDMPAAAVTAAGETKTSLRRDVVLAALAFGWLTPIGPTGGKVRQFKSTDTAIECVRAEIAAHPAPSPERRAFLPAPVQRSTPIEALLRQKQDLITLDHLRTARDFQMIYLAREAATADAYAAIMQSLPPRLLTALEEVCGKGTGFEALERKMKLPARSGKAVVAVALEVLAHAERAA